MATVAPPDGTLSPINVIIVSVLSQRCAYTYLFYNLINSLMVIRSQLIQVDISRVTF